VDGPGNGFASANEHLANFNGLRTGHCHFKSIAGVGFWESYLYPKEHAVFSLIVHRQNSLGLHETAAQMPTEILV